MDLKILMRIHKAGIGGNQKSVLQLVKALKKSGFQFEIAGEKGDLIRNGQFGGFPFHAIPYRPKSWGSISAARRMYLLLRSGQYDLVHVNGFFTGLETVIPASLARVPVVLTLAGGRPPQLPLFPTRKTVCFSEELKEALVGSGDRKESDIVMVGNRIDCSAELNRSRMMSEKYRKPKNRDESDFRIAFTARFDEGKCRSLRHAIEAVDQLAGQRKNFRLDLIGAGEYSDLVSTWAESVNRKRNRTVVHLLGKLENPMPVIKDADLVLGVGLSAFEGMLLGKPTLIVGEQGYAGTVTPGNVKRQAFFNFSGRNQGKQMESVVLSNVMSRLIDNQSLRTRLGQFAKSYAWENLDLSGALPMYEKMYNDPTVREKPGRWEFVLVALSVLRIILLGTRQRFWGSMSMSGADSVSKTKLSDLRT